VAVNNLLSAKNLDCLQKTFAFDCGEYLIYAYGAKAVKASVAVMGKTYPGTAYIFMYYYIVLAQRPPSFRAQTRLIPAEYRHNRRIY
jgi:hypothetical protein